MKKNLGRWWRIYDDVVHTPKVQRLPGDLFKTWINLLCLASSNDGFLPDAEDLAFSLRMPIDAVKIALGILQRQRLLDVVNGQLKPHNWDKRQFKSDHDGAERQRRWYAKHKQKSPSNVIPLTRQPNGTGHEPNDETLS